ncbi:MAG TPA: 23S rRNA (adenine(2503)-C(2))-methyltransferase RlmN [Symbiobacteriaceae bacterium]|nr:23S rRNA (adenine(2503)-C(2))-methyltransferase RlmN [Symbiobacteriaceae bacterium]
MPKPPAKNQSGRPAGPGRRPEGETAQRPNRRPEGETARKVVRGFAAPSPTVFGALLSHPEPIRAAGAAAPVIQPGGAAPTGAGFGAVPAKADPSFLLDLDGKRPLVGMTKEELKAFVESLGEPAFRAKQLFQWVYQKGATTFDQMTNLSAAFRAKLAENARLKLCTSEVAQQAEPTRTTKYLFQLPDGQKVESVLMRHNYGNAVCVTTQVGCRMGCSFCASTFGGLVRNLLAGEIVDQILVMGADLPEGQRIDSVVLMGSGEPMENYDQVLKAVRLMHDPDGLNIGYRHITLSTSGLVPAIYRLTEEEIPITLALSLHAPNDRLRSELMPVNRVWPVQEVLTATRHYAETTGRRVTYEYILIEEVNDNPEEAEQLAALLKGSLAHVNLIPMNPVAERPQYRRPSRERIKRFAEILQGYGLETTVRREMGGDIDAACGQLRNRVERQRNRARS